MTEKQNQTGVRYVQQWKTSAKENGSCVRRKNVSVKQAVTQEGQSVFFRHQIVSLLFLFHFPEVFWHGRDVCEKACKQGRFMTYQRPQRDTKIKAFYVGRARPCRPPRDSTAEAARPKNGPTLPTKNSQTQVLCVEGCLTLGTAAWNTNSVRGWGLGRVPHLWYSSLEHKLCEGLCVCWGVPHLGYSSLEHKLCEGLGVGVGGTQGDVHDTRLGRGALEGKVDF